MIDFTGFIDAWSVTIWRSSWQGSLLAMAVWIVCRLVRSIPARFQCWLWRLVILKFLLALVWFAPVEVPILPAEKPATVQLIAAPSTSLQVESIVVSQKPPRPPAHWLIPFIAWAVIVGWLLVRIGIRCHDANRMRNLSRPISNQLLLDQLAMVGKSLGRQRTPRLLEMDGNGSPMLVGILWPAIVIPATTLSRLDHSERATVFAHELAHARRGDLFWNLMAAVVRAGFFFHPMVWLTERRLRLTHEIAADEFAIALQRNDPVSYGNLLVSIVSKLGPEQLLPTASVGTAGSRESIKERLVAMRFMKPTSVRAAVSCGVLLVAVGLLGVAPWTASAAKAADNIEQPKAATDAPICIEAKPSEFMATIMISKGPKGEKKTVLSCPKLCFIAGQKAEVQIGDQNRRIEASITSDLQKQLIEHTVIVRLIETRESKTPEILAAPRITVIAGKPASLTISSGTDELEIAVTIEQVTPANESAILKK
jgi:beta-lactamase regulating signal transducer with metallopeptidase domain